MPCGRLTWWLWGLTWRTGDSDRRLGREHATSSSRTSTKQLHSSKHLVTCAKFYTIPTSTSTKQYTSARLPMLQQDVEFLPTDRNFDPQGNQQRSLWKRKRAKCVASVAKITVISFFWIYGEWCTSTSFQKRGTSIGAKYRDSRPITLQSSWQDYRPRVCYSAQQKCWTSHQR